MYLNSNFLYGSKFAGLNIHITALPNWLMNGSVEVISKTWKHSTISRFSKHNRQSFPIPEKEIFIHACNWIYLGFNWKSSLMRWICYERLFLIPFTSTMISKILVVFRNIYIYIYIYYLNLINNFDIDFSLLAWLSYVIPYPVTISCRFDFV